MTSRLSGFGLRCRNPVTDVVGYVHVWKQCVLLKNHVNRSLVRRYADDRFTTDEHVSLGRLVKTGDQSQGGCFATTRWPEEAEKSAALNAERNVIYSYHVFESFGDVAKLDIEFSRITGLIGQCCSPACSLSLLINYA